MTLMAADLNAQLLAAVEGRPGWTLAYLGTPRFKAMYAPSDGIRGFIYPSRDGDDWSGWTWFVLQEGSGCVCSEVDLEATAEKTARLLEEFAASLGSA
jgi:hypothetical protein